MNTVLPRYYGCKDEELSVICGFACMSLKRDLSDFTDFSPKYTVSYVSEFDAKILAVTDVLEPKLETIELKTITAHLYATLDGLMNPINRIIGYIELAQPGINISVTDFGLTQMRKAIHSRDAESANQQLRTITTNISKYQDKLMAQGFTEQLAATFTSAATSIAADNKRQYEIITNRRAIVQNNLGLLNALYTQLNEILMVGKILYKNSDPAKFMDYSFNELKKNVRRVSKPTPTDKKVKENEGEQIPVPEK